MERQIIKIELTGKKEALIDMPRYVSVIDLQMLLNAVGELRKGSVIKSVCVKYKKCKNIDKLRYMCKEDVGCFIK